MSTSKTPNRPRRSRSSSAARSRRPKTTASVETTAEVVDAPEPAPEPTTEVIVQTIDPEPYLAARVPPPEAPRPLPSVREAVFFDVENTSRPEHIGRVLDHLQLDWQRRGTELFAVGNWRVIGHETARLLAQRGARLVHSAPSVGVRDWSDLRIAVGAGVWLAGARPGDLLEIVTDDQAFDAVGDVAASLGVGFRRLSYRALAGAIGELSMPEETSVGTGAPSRSRRRGRGRRRNGGGWRDSGPAPRREPVAARAEPAPSGAHTAPHDEILSVVQDLLRNSPAGVTLDMLSNALKARGFRRPPGSPRLITRLHRIKELVVSERGIVRLADALDAIEHVEPERHDAADEGPMLEPGADDESAGEGAPAEGAPPPNGSSGRRRRRRGGRRRRGRGNGQGGQQAAPPVAAAPENGG